MLTLLGVIVIGRGWRGWRGVADAGTDAALQVCIVGGGLALSVGAGGGRNACRRLTRTLR